MPSTGVKHRKSAHKRAGAQRKLQRMEKRLEALLLEKRLTVGCDQPPNLVGGQAH